jgi:Xaa-Pro aminopeptidase
MTITPQEWNAELSSRRAAVRDIMARNDCDVLLVYGATAHGEPFRYLTNFVPVLGDAYAIITTSDIACVLNFNWQLIEAREISGIDDWSSNFDPIPLVVDQLKKAAPKQIGVVGLHRLPHIVYSAIQTALPSIHFVDLGAQVARLRRLKTPLEIRLLKEASRITDGAFDAIRSEIRPGVSEVEVAARLSYFMQQAGAGLSFEPTVVSGNDHPIAIRMPTERKLQKGDSVMIDIGAMYQGYQADASRTFVLGEPNAAQTKVWNVILDAYAAAFEQIRPGNPCVEIQRASVAVIEGAGYKLVHRIGHGIGLATSFEWPSLDSDPTPLEAGMTFCIEPGIYVEGSGDMKLEDDVVVTADGYELLTHCNRELVIPV